MAMRSTVLVLAALLASAGAGLQAQEMVGKYKLVPALPRPGATQILDNDRGRVWDVIYPPGMSTGMHRHPSDFVGVELVETMLKVTTPGRRRARQSCPPRPDLHAAQGPHPYRGECDRPSAAQFHPARTQGWRHPCYDNTASAGGICRRWRQEDGGRQSARDSVGCALGGGRAGQSLLPDHDMFLVPMDAGTLSITSPDDAAKTLPLSGGRWCSFRAAMCGRSSPQRAMSAPRWWS